MLGICLYDFVLQPLCNTSLCQGRNSPQGFKSAQSSLTQTNLIIWDIVFAKSHCNSEQGSFQTSLLTVRCLECTHISPLSLVLHWEEGLGCSDRVCHPLSLWISCDYSSSCLLLESLLMPHCYSGMCTAWPFFILLSFNFDSSRWRNNEFSTVSLNPKYSYFYCYFFHRGRFLIMFHLKHKLTCF